MGKKARQLTALQKFGKLVKRHRLAADLTQEILAADIDSSRGHVQNIESGRSNATFGTIKKLATALGVKMRLLIPHDE